MVEYQNKWVPCLWLVTFNNSGELQSKYTNDKERFEKLNQKHEKITNMRFEKVVFSEEQNNRLQEISKLNISQNYKAEVRAYVENGRFTEGYENPLSDLKLKKEREQHQNDIDEAYQMILESEGLI